MIEAVTGTGKTMVGVAAALDELARRGQVVVLVPTVELQHQWLAELEAPACAPLGGQTDAGVAASGEPGAPSPVAFARRFMGAGDRLPLSHDVLVAVVNSARAVDVRPIRQGGLLVADECHRYGSAVNQLALGPPVPAPAWAQRHLRPRRRRQPGLARPLLRRHLLPARLRPGGRRRVVARFTVTLLGVQFSRANRPAYDELTELMGACAARLVREYGLPDEPFEVFMRAVSVLADSDEAGAGRLGHTASRCSNGAGCWPTRRPRTAALTPVGARNSSCGPDYRLHPEHRVPRAGRDVLAGCGLRAGVMHSSLAGPDRSEIARLFAAGELDVLAAPRVLDEGVDVPAADLA